MKLERLSLANYGGFEQLVFGCVVPARSFEP